MKEGLEVRRRTWPSISKKRFVIPVPSRSEGVPLGKGWLCQGNPFGKCSYLPRDFCGVGNLSIRLSRDSPLKACGNDNEDEGEIKGGLKHAEEDVYANSPSPHSLSLPRRGHFMTSPPQADEVPLPVPLSGIPHKRNPKQREIPLTSGIQERDNLLCGSSSVLGPQGGGDAETRQKTAGKQACTGMF